MSQVARELETVHSFVFLLCTTVLRKKKSGSPEKAPLFCFLVLWSFASGERDYLFFISLQFTQAQ